MELDSELRLEEKLQGEAARNASRSTPFPTPSICGSEEMKWGLCGRVYSYRSKDLETSWDKVLTGY